MNGISIKTQTKRSTRWRESIAKNINVFAPGIEIAVLTTPEWGNYTDAETHIEIEDVVTKRCFRLTPVELINLLPPKFLK